MTFNPQMFFKNVFDPKPGETVAIMYDLPHPDCLYKDNEAWVARRRMAQEWVSALDALGEKMGFAVFSVTYLATGQNNGDLPELCFVNGRKDEVNMNWFLSGINIILSMPEFSATAPLRAYLKPDAKLRLGSMPGLTRVMLDTGLAADYGEIKRRCAVIKPRMQEATGAIVEFSTGHKMFFDLRFNKAHGDDGDLRLNGSFANLPAGEVFQAPFEGNENELSKTEGEIPIVFDGAFHLLYVEHNRIIHCTRGCQGINLGHLFGTDDLACRNIAEFAIGVNEGATLTGSILQDEKALGFHWARGRSEHLGGSVGPAQFLDPKNVVHQDYVYPISGADITVKQVHLIFPELQSEMVIGGGRLLV